MNLKKNLFLFFIFVAPLHGGRKNVRTIFNSLYGLKIVGQAVRSRQQFVATNLPRHAQASITFYNLIVTISSQENKTLNDEQREILNQQIKNGANINAHFQNDGSNVYMTPLDYACQMDHMELIHYLSDNGAIWGSTMEQEGFQEKAGYQPYTHTIWYKTK